MSVQHYENFPVASWLCPARLRPGVAAIYWFARYADDLADEGDWTAEQRVERLLSCQAQLQKALAQPMPANTPGTKQSSDAEPMLTQVREVTWAVRHYDLPASCLFDLLSAFLQDCQKNRYQTEVELLDYCTRSANPVGRLMLALWGISSRDAMVWSDSICTGLQLINHWQDVAVDAKKDRIYLPLQELQAAGVSEHDILLGRCPTALSQLLRNNVQKAMNLLRAGAPLTKLVGGRLGWELRLVIAGGLRIGERLLDNGCNPFLHRPTISWKDGPSLFKLAWQN